MEVQTVPIFSKGKLRKLHSFRLEAVEVKHGETSFRGF